MRCPSCNKFPAFEQQEPEVSDLETAWSNDIQASSMDELV